MTISVKGAQVRRIFPCIFHILEKNCLQNLNLFLKELAPCIFIFQFFDFEIWRVTFPLRQYLYAFYRAWTVLLSGPSIDARFVILWHFEFFKKGRSSSNFRKIRAIEYIISIKELWYWIWPNSIEAFKFFQILNFLRIFWILSNSGKLRFIELKFCA